MPAHALRLTFVPSLLCPQTVCTRCLLAHFCQFRHAFTHLERERREAEHRFTFWFVLNGNFCSARMFAGLPTRPALQLWNERRNISLWPQRKRAKPELAPTYMHSHTFICTNKTAQSNQPWFLSFLQCVHTTPAPPAHKLLAGARVSPKPQRRIVCVGFIFWPQRKEIHETIAHQWTLFLWRKRISRQFGFCNGSYYWVKNFFKLLSGFASFTLWVRVAAAAVVYWSTLTYLANFLLPL